MSWRKLPAGRVRHSGTPTIPHLNLNFSPTTFPLSPVHLSPCPPRNDRPERSKNDFDPNFCASSYRHKCGPGPISRASSAESPPRCPGRQAGSSRPSPSTTKTIVRPNPLLRSKAPGQSWLLSTLDLPYFSEYRMLPYLGQSPVLPEHLQVRLPHYRILHMHEGLQNGEIGDLLCFQPTPYP